MTKVITDIITASELLKNDVKHLQISQDGTYSLSLLSSVRRRVCWGDLELRPYTVFRTEGKERRAFGFAYIYGFPLPDNPEV